MPITSSLPGIGLGRAAGRGIVPPSNATLGSAAHGLSGPVRGIGGPAPGKLIFIF